MSPVALQRRLTGWLFLLLELGSRWSRTRHEMVSGRVDLAGAQVCVTMGEFTATFGA